VQFRLFQAAKTTSSVSGCQNYKLQLATCEERCVVGPSEQQLCPPHLCNHASDEVCRLQRCSLRGHSSDAVEADAVLIWQHLTHSHRQLPAHQLMRTLQWHPSNSSSKEMSQHVMQKPEALAEAHQCMLPAAHKVQHFAAVYILQAAYSCLAHLLSKEAAQVLGQQAYRDEAVTNTCNTPKERRKQH
jgi:hypothetical protein